jgi:hypothetical protein
VKSRYAVLSQPSKFDVSESTKTFVKKKKPASEMKEQMNEQEILYVFLLESDYRLTLTLHKS